VCDSKEQHDGFVADRLVRAFQTLIRHGELRFTDVDADRDFLRLLTPRTGRATGRQRRGPASAMRDEVEAAIGEPPQPPAPADWTHQADWLIRACSASHGRAAR
jgi:hypothetical protein